MALQLLRVLTGEHEFVRIEAVGDDEVGVDLWIGRPDGTQVAQQCKRQNTSSGGWTLAVLASRDVLTNLAFQLARKPSIEFAFVSGDPVPTLDDLCTRVMSEVAPVS